MEATSKRVSSLLLELEEEMAAKDREIADLQAQLAGRSDEVPDGLRALIELQKAQLERTGEVLRLPRVAQYDFVGP